MPTPPSPRPPRWSGPATTSPYLAHAAMEPMNCVIRLSADGCEVWNGEQMHTGDQYALAGLFGFEARAGHHPHPLRRRRFPGVAPARTPITCWRQPTSSRPSAARYPATPRLARLAAGGTMRAGYYRPAFPPCPGGGHRRRRQAGRLAPPPGGGSPSSSGPPEKMLVRDGIDGVSVEGAANLPTPSLTSKVDLHPTDIGVPVLWWRSVGSSHGLFDRSLPRSGGRCHGQGSGGPAPGTAGRPSAPRGRRQAGRRKRPAGALPEAGQRPANGGVVGWRCMSPSTPTSPRWPR